MSAATDISRSLFQTTENILDRQVTVLAASKAVVADGYVMIREKVPLGSSSTVISKTNPASESIVGWSNSSVCGNSAFNQAASVFVNSVAAIESSPPVIRGKFVATAVPSKNGSWNVL